MTLNDTQGTRHRKWCCDTHINNKTESSPALGGSRAEKHQEAVAEALRSVLPTHMFCPGRDGPRRSTW